MRVYISSRDFADLSTDPRNSKLPRLDLWELGVDWSNASCVEWSGGDAFPRTASFADQNFTAVYTILGTCFVFVAIFVVDRVGRRTMFRTCIFLRGLLTSRTESIANDLSLCSDRLSLSCSLSSRRSSSAVSLSWDRQLLRSGGLPDFHLPVHRLLPIRRRALVYLVY